MSSGLLATIAKRAESLSLQPRQRGAHLDLRCPAHDDKRPSLSVDERDGKIVLFCHAGCAAEDVVRALGLTWSDLFEASPPNEGSKIIDEYPYHDETGNLLYQVVRLEGKAFRQRRPNGHGGWIWNMNGTRRVPYRLPEMLRAVAKDPVFVVEGEKDADRLIREGLTATCNPGGAGKWRKEFAEFFKGALVVVIPDNDELGRKHAEEVATSLTGVAKQVKVLQFPDVPEGGDVSDFFSGGGTAEEIAELLKRTQGFRSQAEEVLTGRLSTKQAEAQEGDGLRAIRASDLELRPVEWLLRDRIALRALNLLAGEGGKGKSALAVEWAARATRGQLDGRFRSQPINVLWVGNEDGREDVIGPRLKMAGADMDRVLFLTVDAESLVDGINIVADVDKLKGRCKQHEAKLIVLDPVVEYLPSSTDSHNDMSVRQALRPVRNMAAEVDISVLGLVHFNKGATLDVASRIAASAGFRNAARSVLVVADHPEDEGWRVLFQHKTNWGPQQRSGRAYKVEGIEVTDRKDLPMLDHDGEPFTTARIVWGGDVELDPGSLPGGNERKTPQRDAARELLEALFEDFGSYRRDEIEKQAKLEGIAWRTIRRAADEMGVEKRQFHEPGKRGGGPWWWGPQGFDWDVWLSTSSVSDDGQPNPGHISAGQHVGSAHGDIRLVTKTETGSDVNNLTESALEAQGRPPTRGFLEVASQSSEPMLEGAEDTLNELDEATARVRTANPELYRR